MKSFPAFRKQFFFQIAPASNLAVSEFVVHLCPKKKF